MFNCNRCENVISGRMFKVVTKKRDKEYFNIITKYRDDEKVEVNKVSKGWEIIEELGCCEPCSKELSGAK